MDKREIVAMAVAAIAEELDTDVKRIRVISFKENDDLQGDNQ